MYTTVEDIIRDARIIRDRLASIGETEVSRELTEVIEHPWTFGSEALIEIGLALKNIRSNASARLQQDDVKLLDTLITETRRMFESTNP